MPAGGQTAATNLTKTATRAGAAAAAGLSCAALGLPAGPVRAWQPAPSARTPALSPAPLRTTCRPHAAPPPPERVPPFDNMAGDHPDHVFIRTVPNCFVFHQVSRQLSWQGGCGVAGGAHGIRLPCHPARPACQLCPTGTQDDWRRSRPGQQVVAVWGAVPSAREKLLLVDAVRLLPLEPLSSEAQLTAIYTVNAG